MSSNEDEYDDGEVNSGVVTHGQKKRKIQRACDTCRRKKIRCDGPQLTGNKCSNCVAYNVDCTFDEMAKKRGRPKGYVEGLERRVQKLEKVLRKLCPDEVVYKDLLGYIDGDESGLEKMPALTPDAYNQEPSKSSTEGLEMIRKIASTLGTKDDPFRDDDFNYVYITKMMSKLSVDPDDLRFFGKSSGAMLAHNAMEMKSQYVKTNIDDRKYAMECIRPRFWTKPPWESSMISAFHPQYTFPEQDLMADLIDLYFKYKNLYLPLLHRPTFERSVAEGLHYRDKGFAVTLLLVCALAARSSSDPRVRLEGDDLYHSNGWKWFQQVKLVQNSLLNMPSLYDLQSYCLAAQYLQGCFAAQSCWTLVGVGLRMALDVGAHRRKLPSKPPSVEDELWKRAFWVLLCIDRAVSVFMGRPCAIFDEEIDLDMPIECDDEFWEHPDPELRFKQPPGKPCRITAFILLLRLNRILAFSLHTIYSIKTKLFGFITAHWEQYIVTELDSAMNKWLEGVPDYLRWDPKREDTDLFNLAAMLTAWYYHVQTLIHRPFIPSPGKSSSLTFPSLAICTNAARSCSHVLDIQRKRGPDSAISPLMQMCAFTCGIVLLLDTWGGKRLGLGPDPNKELRNVTKCMELLKASEDRWHPAGRFWDILRELASVGELLLPGESASSSPSPRGQPKESPLPIVPQTQLPSFAGAFADGPRTIAGSRRARQSSAMTMAESQRPQSQSQSQSPASSLTCPVSYLSPGQECQPELSAAMQLVQQQEQQTAYSQQQQQQQQHVMYGDKLNRSHSQPSLRAQPPVGSGGGGINYWTMPPSQYSSSDESAPSTSSSIPMGYVNVPQMNASYSGNTQPSQELSSMHEPTAMNYPQVPASGPSYLTEDALSARGAGAGGQPTFDSDMMSMWMNAPFGFESEDWGAFLANMGELTHHGQQQPGPGLGIGETLYPTPHGS